MHTGPAPSSKAAAYPEKHHVDILLPKRAGRRISSPFTPFPLRASRAISKTQLLSHSPGAHPPSPPYQLLLLSTHPLLAPVAGFPSSEPAAAWCFISLSPWQLAYSLTLRDPCLTTAINQPPACNLGQRWGSRLILHTAGSFVTAIPTFRAVPHRQSAVHHTAALKQSLAETQRNRTKMMLVFPVRRQTGATRIKSSSFVQGEEPGVATAVMQNFSLMQCAGRAAPLART